MASIDADTTIEDAAVSWRAFGKALRDTEDGPHPGANTLSFHRDRMVSARERLLALGLDLTDLRKPHVCVVVAGTSAAASAIISVRPSTVEAILPTTPPR